MTGRRTAWWVAGLVGVFVVLALPWFQHLRTALPADDATEDAWLVLWVLEWVRHALGTAPSQLFDPPVNWPAPHQLAGSEHFLASQLAYVPLRWITGSAVAAANLTAWLSYVLAAVAMQALCVRLGIGSGAAFVVAVAYGFGWHGTPGRVHILQSQHLWLPLIALALDRLRQRANAGRATVVAVVVGAALLSSYHMAVYAGVATALWGTAELVRRDAGRGRYFVAAGLACAVAVAVLVVVSLPYLARPEARGEVDLVFSRWKTSHLAPQADDFQHADPLLVARTYLGCALGGGQRLACVPVDWLAERVWMLVLAGALAPFTLVLPLLLLAGVARAALARDRAVVWIGLWFVLAGLLLYGPESIDMGGMRIPFPRALVAASPARFIRESQRALVLSFFGAGLIAACGLDTVLARCARPLRPVLVAALTLMAVIRVPATLPSSAASSIDPIARWGRLAPVRWLDNPALGPDAASYRELAVVVAAAPGPLLDLPDTPDGAGVMGQTIHGQPSIDFYTGYLPPHVSMVQALIAALPDADALDDLIAMTGLRWIVLRPAVEWPAGDFERARAAFATHPRTVAVRPVGGFTVVELDPRSRHPEWFQSLAAGPRRGFSSLGTPLEKVPAAARLAMAVDPFVHAGAPTTVRLSLANTGPHGWPAAVPARPDAPMTVRLELGWSSRPDAIEVYTLRRDVPAGETLEQRIVTTAPDRSGRAILTVALVQVQGGELATARSDVDVLPPGGAQ
jgi:hypothetical protein